jgi:hypothetical protein
VEPGTTSERHRNLARSLVSHFVNNAVAVVVGSLGHVEGALGDKPRPLALEASTLQSLDDAKLGLERLLTVTSALLAGLPSGEGHASLGAAGRVLVVSDDSAASAAVCAALHGDSVTVCDTIPQALRIIERAEPFEVIFCDAAVAAAWLLVRVAWQEPPPRMVFMATRSSDPGVAEFLSRQAPLLDAPRSPQSFGQIRELAAEAH